MREYGQHALQSRETGSRYC